MIRFVFALMLLLAGFARPAMAAAAAPLQAADEDIAAFFDEFIANKAAELEIPGAAVVVVRDGRVILGKTYGYADFATREPLDLETSLFRAASISKLLPWLLVMQGVEEGRLDLDRDIQDYLDFRVPEAFGNPITLRHLMTHTAGFPERFHGVFDPDLETPLGRKLAENLPERVNPPGSVVAYSNYGAALAGYIVQRQLGEPWEALVQSRVFDRIGMRHATVAQPVPVAMQADLVLTYPSDSNQPAPFRTTPLAPMGSLTASAADMGRLLQMLSRQGQGANGQVVAADTLASMMSLQRPLGPGLADGLGLGFLVGEYRGVRYAGHAGNMSTLATDLEVLPDHGLAWYYVFSAQGPGEQARKVRRELLQATVDRFVAKTPPTLQALDPSSAEAVAGGYISSRRLHSGPLMFSGLMDQVRVTALPNGGLEIEASGSVSQWLPAGPDRFVDAASGTPLAVSRDDDGSVARIASAVLYPVAEFERAPAYLALVPGLAAFALLTLVAAAFLRPLAWVRRKLRPQAAGEPLLSPTRLRARRWAGHAYRLLMFTLLAWGLVGLGLGIDFTLLFTIPPLAWYLLAALSMLASVTALVMIHDAIVVLRDAASGWGERIVRVVLGAAALVMAWLFFQLDLVNAAAPW